jgi:hypothetical protein
MKPEAMSTTSVDILDPRRVSDARLHIRLRISHDPAQPTAESSTSGAQDCYNLLFDHRKCDAGTPCEKCEKMRPSLTMLACNSTPLDLLKAFLPGREYPVPVATDRHHASPADPSSASCTGQHHPDYLRAFGRIHVQSWTDDPCEVKLTWGHGPYLTCPGVQRIVPIGDNLRSSFAYHLDPLTSRYELKETPSPLIGLRVIDLKWWRSFLNTYFDGVTQDQFHGFSSACIRDEVQKELVDQIFKYTCPGLQDRVRMYDMGALISLTTALTQLPRLCLKLIVLTFVMTHSLTYPPEDEKEGRVLTCPRFLNKQLKFILYTLHSDILNAVLQRLHHALRNRTKKRSQ